MKRIPLSIEDCGIVTALGRGKKETAEALFAGSRSFVERKDLLPGRAVWVGAAKGELLAVPVALSDIESRNNRLMQAALMQIAPAVEKAKARFGRDRIAVVLGTSTSGLSDGEDAFAEREKMGAWPDAFHYRKQEIGNLSSFAARYFDLSGPAYTIATACSSSAKVFASARRLVNAGLADAAIVGGADTLCRMTLNGFNSLELLSENPCNPFSLNRNGITIGEGAAAFLLTKDSGPVQLLGVGETSDAHHPTAPAPDGAGALEAMQQALQDARLDAGKISYINLHGTATPLNDAMEAKAVSALFGNKTPCSSTKGMTGHMLGATGGCEAAFMWLCLNSAFNAEGRLPPHIWDGVADPELPPLVYTTPSMSLPTGPSAMLSNSFGFGGSNVSLIFGRA